MSNPDPKPPEADPPETDVVSREGGFDERKRQKVLALLANGSSRRMAARYFGVAASTITRAGVRDPDFGRQLAEAEQSSEIEILRAIRGAARKAGYWRAGAWLLERRNPDDFAPAPPASSPMSRSAR